MWPSAKHYAGPIPSARGWVDVMETFIIVVALLAIVVLGALVVYRLNVLQGQRVARFHGSHFIQGPYVPPPTPRRVPTVRRPADQRKNRARAAAPHPTGATRVGK